MGTLIINSGVINDDTGVLLNLPSPFPPFLKGHGVYCEELIVGTDFTSGDDIVLNFEGSDKILFAIVVTNIGAIKAYAEADIGGSVITGRKLTISAATTNLKIYVVYST